MQSINALSLAPDAHDWLVNSYHPRILHIFDHACNLINERREVLSIVTPQIGNGPFNLVIEDESILFSNQIKVESSISIEPNQLIISDIAINTHNAKLWSPRPDWEMLHAEKDDIAKLLLTNYQKCGLDTPFATNAQGYSTTALQSELPITNLQPFDTASPLRASLQSLISAIATADIQSSIISASKLAGLGIGLTPAGDDFILGAMYAAWIIHPFEQARVLVKEITNTTAPLTTSLSAAWLRSVGRGESGVLWHEFFDALISADPVHIQEAMDKILAVGATSGADAMAGFISLFIYWGEHCSNLWEYNPT